MGQRRPTNSQRRPTAANDGGYHSLCIPGNACTITRTRVSFCYLACYFLLYLFRVIYILYIFFFIFKVRAGVGPGLDLAWPGPARPLNMRAWTCPWIVYQHRTTFELHIHISNQRGTEQSSQVFGAHPYGNLRGQGIACRDDIPCMA